MSGWLNPHADACSWTEGGPASAELVSTLSGLYWEGLTREISYAILARKLLGNERTQPEENDIMKRLPQSAFHFIQAWAPWTIDIDREYDDMQESVAICMTERQRPDVEFRRSRMLLQGLTTLDIDRLVEFREPLLISQTGEAQVNIARISHESGSVRTIVHLLSCCECQKTIRTSFFECNQGCVHQDVSKDSRCNWAKHQFIICTECHPASGHTKQHLKKVRPYDPVEVNLDPPLAEKEAISLRPHIKKLKKKEDEREDNERSFLRRAVQTSPEFVIRKMLPFGNIHESVTLGPLILEIGVKDTKGGVLISLRRPPDLAFSENWKYIDASTTTPAVAVSPSRQVFTRVQERSRRQTHASLKQVVGGLFSGHRADWLEAELGIINSFTKARNKFEENPMKSSTFNRRQLRQKAEELISKLKSLISDEVQLYLTYFAARIMDPSIDLTWNQYPNNCQAFCNNVLAGQTFDTILPRHNPMVTASQTQTPAYLLSFTSKNFGSLFDTRQFQTVPSAVYFRELHTSEDLIEYFDTWPAIPLQTPCSKLFCWPCLNKDHCSLCEHMWLMPHETTSILQLHLIRERSSYNQQFKTFDPREEAPVLVDEEWMSNRLQILLALDSFLGAAGGLSRSYQERIDLLAKEGEAITVWTPRSANETRLIQPPSKEGEYNFTIASTGGDGKGWMLPFSKNWRMKRWLEKTTVEKGDLRGNSSNG